MRRPNDAYLPDRLGARFARTTFSTQEPERYEHDTDLDPYFAYMNRALDAHTIIPLTLMYSPLFAKARADARYHELLERVRKQYGLTK